MRKLLERDSTNYILGKKWDLLLIPYVISILLLFGNYKSLYLIDDLRFLYNRAEQLLYNLTNGGSLFFFYNDFDGLGYGSTFFYGYLTLFPFVPFVKLGFVTFIKIYESVTILIIYYGILTLAKRFTVNYRFIGLLWLFSTFSLFLFRTYTLLSNLLGFGLSLFCLAYFVDYFRENKNDLLSTLLFFLVMNTHLLSSIFTFVFVVCLFIKYFDTTKIKNYVLFIGLNLLINLYTIMNFLYHLQAVRHINIISVIQNSTLFCADIIPIGGIFTIKANLWHNGFHFFNWITFVLLCYLFIRDRKLYNKQDFVLMFICVLSFVVGNTFVWTILYTCVPLLIQFSIRYILYTFIIALFVVLRKISLQKIFVFFLLFSCIIDFSFCNKYIQELELNEDEIQHLEETYYVMQGEYLSDTFDWNTYKNYKNKVTDQNGVEYQYSETKSGELSVVIQQHEESLLLTFPQLYYNGYVCYNDKGTYFTVESGESNFINVDIAKYNGTIILKYKQPTWLSYIFFIDICMFLYMIFICVARSSFYAKVKTTFIKQQ